MKQLLIKLFILGLLLSISGCGNYKKIFTFNNDELSSPNILIQAKDGGFYGTTDSRFDSTIFSFIGDNYNVMYKFKGYLENDGYSISSFIQGKDGGFYGTTSRGGVPNGYDEGTMFKITPLSKYMVIYSFHDDGIEPNSLIQGNDGNFYGTTNRGGTNDNGTVFMITSQGKESTIYRFQGESDDVSQSDGISPSNLIQDSEGNLYGITNRGGINDNGIVFKINPQGNYTIIYKFNGGMYGANPINFIQGKDKNFYGVTEAGGIINNANNRGCGIMFKITPKGKYSVILEKCVRNLIQANDGGFYGNIDDDDGDANVVHIVKSVNATYNESKIILNQGINLNILIHGNDKSINITSMIQANDGNLYGVGYTRNASNVENNIIFKINIPHY